MFFPEMRPVFALATILSNSHLDGSARKRSQTVTSLAWRSAMEMCRRRHLSSEINLFSSDVACFQVKSTYFQAMSLVFK
jgi:hypothetical protein